MLSIITWLAWSITAQAFPNLTYRGFYFDETFRSYTGQLCLDLGHSDGETSVSVRWGTWQTEFSTERRYLELTAFGNNPLELQVWQSRGESQAMQLQTGACDPGTALSL